MTWMHHTERFEVLVADVERIFGVRREDLWSVDRHRSLVRPRQIIWWVMRQPEWSAPARTPSLPEIGMATNRDHTSVMHGLKRIAAELDQDADLRAIAEQLRGRRMGPVGTARRVRVAVEEVA